MTWSDKLVTAIYLNARGVTFVAFGPFARLDWSIVEAGGGERKQKILTRINLLFAQSTPDVVVLQDMSHKGGTHRPHRIRHLNEAIAEAAEQYGFPIVFISRAEVRQHFAYLGRVTKDTIAAAIAKHIPAFDRFLPPPRKPWKSEDARMGLFDAAALALTFFHANVPRGD
jgi:hypothetical protein